MWIKVILTALYQGVIACGMSTAAMLLTWAWFERRNVWEDGEKE